MALEDVRGEAHTKIRTRIVAALEKEFGIAVLAAVALGLQKDIERFDYGYLLLFVVPLLCAYVDMLAYERSTAIHVIAKHIREYTGDDKEMLDLKGYENFVAQLSRWRVESWKRSRASLPTSAESSGAGALPSRAAQRGAAAAGQPATRLVRG